MKEEGDDGYDTEHTADLTSDDSEEEEGVQIEVANVMYKFGLKENLKSKRHKRMDLESLRGCYTGKIMGSDQASDRVEQLAKPSLYGRKLPSRF